MGTDIVIREKNINENLEFPDVVCLHYLFVYLEQLQPLAPQADLPAFFWAARGPPAKKLDLGTRRFLVTPPNPAFVGEFWSKNKSYNIIFIANSFSLKQIYHLYQIIRHKN